MSNTRKILKIFVASPGDLQEERKVIRNVALEFNESWAEHLGYQIELLGWEDTLPGVGRPQHLINKDLDACVFFIGMIWRRWGTPPSDDGNYTSGFEEEFERSMERYQQFGAPEIALFFKDITDEAKNDPGPVLTKVLEFREKIESERKVLYGTFSSVEDIQVLARKSISHFVNQVIDREASVEPPEVGASQSVSGIAESESEHTVSNDTQKVDEQLSFLEKLTEKYRESGDLRTLMPSEIARFRLLGNCVTTSSNDDKNLGSHDINLLFAAKISGMKFSGREVLRLVQAGFQHLADENVPLWGWYSMLSNAPYDAALYSSLYGENDDEKVGAIRVLRALELDISGEDGTPTKDCAYEKWFSEHSASKVRLAALEYLKEKGTMDDYAVATHEFDRNDISTSRCALECMVRISLRHEQHDVSSKLILESQFESLDSDLLNAVLDSFDELDTTVLQLGLEHNNKEVRRRAVSILRTRGTIDLKLAEQLTHDSDALIRREAILTLNSLGKSFSGDEVKRILTEPRNSLSFGGLIAQAARTNHVLEGEVLFAQHELERLKQHPESELTKRVELGLMFVDAPYFARAERYIKRYADELRSDVDDKFLEYFNKRIDRVTETPFGKGLEGKELLKQLRNMEDFYRKRLTRRGLDILCRAGEAQDQDRIRSNLNTGYAEVSALDAKYIGKFGEWSDIVLLAQAKLPMSGGSLLGPTSSEEFYDEIAKSMLELGKKKSISNLLLIELPNAALERVIKLCSDARFSRISEKALFQLFNHESSSVRKAASIKAIRSHSTKRISSLLHKYVNSEKYRYYNVIHWLDLGSSMSRDAVRKVTSSVVD